MSKSVSLELWLRGLFAAGVYLAATALMGLSIFAVEGEQTGPGDADSTAGAYFCLVLAAALLALVTWMTWRGKIARVFCLLLAALIVVMWFLVSSA